MVVLKGRRPDWLLRALHRPMELIIKKHLLLMLKMLLNGEFVEEVFMDLSPGFVVGYFSI